MNTYDYIIAGGGCAGLSLAYHMQQADLLRDRSVLIIDRSRKVQNDRTWCFWSKGRAPFEDLLTCSWSSLSFFAPGCAIRQTLAPYRYSLLRSIDFYRFIRRELKDHPNIHWLEGNITNLREDPDGPLVVVDDHYHYRGRWIFNSCSKVGAWPDPNNSPRYLLQHFKGWTIRSPRPVFDSDTATLMDFRLPQHDQARFGYVLPFSSHRALVEFTVFSESRLPAADYNAALRDYIYRRYGLTEFEVEEEEFGVIPMTDAPFPSHYTSHILQIGTAGGAVKPSTGYAFLNIQRQTRHLANSLANSGIPLFPPERLRRFRFYDTLLLDILKREGGTATDIFRRLFTNNSFPLILQFLDEQTHIGQEARIFASLPFRPFLQAVWNTQRPGTSPLRTQPANTLK